MFKLIADWHHRRETIRELSRLSDRELTDLGVARADIKAVAGGAALAARGAMATTVEAVTRAYEGPDAMAPAWGAHNRRSLAA